MGQTMSDGQSISNVRFNKNGWIASKEPIISGKKYSITMKARLLQDYVSGGAIFVATCPTPKTGMLFYMANKAAESVPSGLRFSQHDDGMPNFDILIGDNIEIIDWHDIGFSRDGSTWTIWIDDKIKQVTHDRPAFPLANAFIGGSKVLSKWFMADNLCIKDVRINDKDITTTDYYIYGNISFCKESYETDAVAVAVNGKLLSCSTGCGDVKYKTHYTENTPWDSIKCCSGKNQVTIPTNMCSIGLDNTNEDPLIAYQYTDSNNVQCIYDRSKITSLDQVKVAAAKFGGKNPISDAFCQSKVATCPPGYTSGCSRYLSSESDGDYCRSIFNNLSDAEKDSAIANYCSRNSTEDCKCANRSFDPDYVRLKQGNPFSDACWYIPCANSANYLVPSEFNKNPDCPANICQIVFDISQAHNVDIDHLKSDINCDFGGGKYPPHSPLLWYYISGLVLALILLIAYASK